MHQARHRAWAASNSCASVSHVRHAARYPSLTIVHSTPIRAHLNESVSGGFLHRRALTFSLPIARPFALHAPRSIILPNTANVLKSALRNRPPTSTSFATRTYCSSTPAPLIAATGETYTTGMKVWMGTCAAMTFAMVVVGGMTRLTESGLSIVQWKPLSGAKPPMNEEDWLREFENYKQFPEYQRTKQGMTLEGFKQIFWWEWGHRNLGRLIGCTFVLPYLGWLVLGRRFRSGPLAWQLPMIGLGIGFQGALGWYMVKSGLQDDVIVPRVSPYRLTAHLASAFALYSGMLWIFMDMCTANSKTVITEASTAINQAGVQRFKRAVGLSTVMVAITVLAGAFVAGNDAGLIYNEFPLMGGKWIPPELLDMKPLWRNFFENDVTVQFNHRYLGMSTLAIILTTYIMGRRLKLPTSVRLPMHHLAAMGCIQVGLGIFTLLSFVHTHVAATHQAGSLTLLSISLWLLHALKRLPK